MSKAHAMLRTASSTLLLLGCSSCTLVTGAGDYEVDPEREQQEIDNELMSRVRTLDYEILEISNALHIDRELDVAVVNEGLIQARARIIVQPMPTDEQPVERLVMTNALVPGAHDLYFYVDHYPDYVPQAEDKGELGREHMWIQPVDPDGGGSFTHSTIFQDFDEDDFALVGRDVVLKIPKRGALGGGELPGDDQSLRDCVTQKVADAVTSTLEARLFLAGTERQVGLFKLYKGSKLPQRDDVKLVGIVDGGSTYELRVAVDGKIEETVEKVATGGDLVFEFEEWSPFEKFVVECLTGM